jgi:hypothetical protein
LSRAAEIAPDLMCLAADGNDILRRTDGDVLAPHFEQAAPTSRRQAAEFHLHRLDMRMFPVTRLPRGRIA